MDLYACRGAAARCYSSAAVALQDMREEVLQSLQLLQRSHREALKQQTRAAEAWHADMLTRVAVSASLHNRLSD